MYDYDVNPRNYFRILNQLLNTGKDRGPGYVSKVIRWLQQNLSIMHEVLTDEQMKIIQKCYQYFDKHRSLPSEESLKILLRREAKVESSLILLDEYGKQDLQDVPVSDLDTYLDALRGDVKKARLSCYLETAIEITINQYQMQDRAKTILKGPEDAMAYIAARLEQGFAEDDPTRWCGTPSDLSDSVSTHLADTVGLSSSIMTGIPSLDAMGGLRKGSFVTVLSYTGGRKTTLCRNIAFVVAQIRRFCMFPWRLRVRKRYWSTIAGSPMNLGTPFRLPTFKAIGSPKRRQITYATQSTLNSFADSETAF